MDAYMAKLEQAASAPDEAFPELLFAPLTNNFDDQYFKMSVEDYNNPAMEIDPRFTRRNIQRIRGSCKRIDQYLAWTSLYNDYMDYLTSKYGSLDMAEQMSDAGMITDPIPPITHRPILRKKKLRRLLKSGVVPSPVARGISYESMLENLKQVTDEYVEENPLDSVPDPNYSPKPSKRLRKILEANAKKMRQMQRSKILASGSPISGIGSNMDFVDHYYVNLESGKFNTKYGNSTKNPNALTTLMREAEDRKYWTQAQIWDAEDSEEGDLNYDGYMIRDRRKYNQNMILKDLQTYTGIDVIGTMSSRGMSKKSIKAARAGLKAVGCSVGLTKKEQKKLKKKQKKIAAATNRALDGDQKMAEILLNNKIMLNGGTIRFEDGLRRR